MQRKRNFYGFEYEKSLIAMFYARLLWMVCLIAIILGLGLLAYRAFILYRDIDAVIERAQIAADREDMAEYVGSLRVNMQLHGMTQGHFALVFRTPANDLALHYQMLGRLLERLKYIKSLAKHDAAYQVALADIRGNLREMKKPALYFFWVCYWWQICLIGILVILMGWVRLR